MAWTFLFSNTYTNANRSLVAQRRKKLNPHTTTHLNLQISDPYHFADMQLICC